MIRRPVVLSVFLLAGCGGGSPTVPSVTVTTQSSFQGVWTGTWQRQSCAAAVGIMGFNCNSLPTSGGLRIILTASGSTLNGTVEIGSTLVPVSGSVTSGTLTLTGSTHIQNATTSISNWATTVPGISMNVMTGAFSFTIAPDDVSPATATIRASLENVSK